MTTTTYSLRLTKTSRKHQSPVFGTAQLVDEDGLGLASCNYFESNGNRFAWTSGHKASNDPVLLAELVALIEADNKELVEA